MYYDYICMLITLSHLLPVLLTLLFFLISYFLTFRPFLCVEDHNESKSMIPLAYFDHKTEIHSTLHNLHNYLSPSLTMSPCP